MFACAYLTGLTFGRWTVLRYGHASRRHYWLCRCACGEERELLGNDLTRGRSKSCGCYAKEVGPGQNRRNATKHGFRFTRLYSIWTGMKKRCHYPKHKHFGNYGGRATERCPAGIYVCDEWLDPAAFIRWSLLHGYLDADTQTWFWAAGAPALIIGTDALTIERIDNDGPYEPANCTWATRSEQNLHKWRKAPAAYDAGARGSW